MVELPKLKLGAAVIRMNHLANVSVDTLVGGELGTLRCQPLPPYHPEVINFLAALSSCLLSSTEIRKYPDIAGFAYWCRRSNLARLSRGIGDGYRRLGRGLVLHIAPANVPVNFAFSMAFGLLAGNANIVRVSEMPHQQVAVICREMAALLGQTEHNRISDMIRVITYPRNDEITEMLSAVSHARILWGGDATVGHLRSMKTSPRCLDVSFSDRYSISIFGAEAVLSAQGAEISTLVEGFYNDVFLLDQNACSSPHLLLWQGEDIEINAAQRRFWGAMEACLVQKQSVSAIHSIDKYSHLCRVAIELDACQSAQTGTIYRVQLKRVPADIERYRGRHGFFFEAKDTDLHTFESIVNERYQTVTYFGIDPEIVVNRIVEAGLVGVDRVVPVGKALDIGVIWDGYDLVGMLSRIVAKT